MAGDWKQNKNWSDKYLTQIKRILGEHFIGEPPIKEDIHRNTDLMVLNMTGLRFGCRVRKEKYYENYKDEFTLRCKVYNGGKTELTKIIEGWGDYFFYGFANESCVFHWKIGDMKEFRLWFSRRLAKNNGRVPGELRSNHDKSSDFMVFRWPELPPKFIYAQS